MLDLSFYIDLPFSQYFLESRKQKEIVAYHVHVKPAKIATYVLLQQARG